MGISCSSWKLFSPRGLSEASRDVTTLVSRGPCGSRVQMEFLSPGPACLGGGVCSVGRAVARRDPGPRSTVVFLQGVGLGGRAASWICLATFGETQSVEGRGRRHPSMWQCPHDWAAAWPARSCAWSPPQRDSRASLPRRLEQPYFSANAQFFQALSQCSALQRLCLVSRSGTLQPEAVLAFMARCLRVVVCHMFTGESLATCKSLQQSLLRR